MLTKGRLSHQARNPMPSFHNCVKFLCLHMHNFTDLCVIKVIKLDG